ncbi:MAG: eukaryotic-like serine/threonine-protein kinase [Cyanobacteriota bacterium erpe_2018_sw_21hr_WHONDRS-SW48-000092_B_bin.40]|jgi:serine/threonine protein kinase|nr:eukaryotic-like serine/threonine-protein kinase [Cyanobacteriota bacterium erpe_2018_sw_21hr_WHONDRS-SW48-000092_B_bin.40]
MGHVYLVDHAALNRRFALKVLSPQLVNEETWLRFQSEAKTLATLNHPIFVKVYDLGIHEHSVPYYSMDFISGRSLEEILDEDGPLPANEALDLFIEALDGLAYAHRNGIIHRDIKPANIMRCSNDGTASVKILDFGISKLIGAKDKTAQGLTSAGEIFGSPFYMSPEQSIGGSIDSRSDIYSIGCTMFEVLSGFVPFEGSNPFETLILHQESAPPLLSEVAPQLDLSPSIDLVLSKCLAKRPQDRYQSAKELAIDLTRIKENKEILTFQGPTHNLTNSAALNGENGSRFKKIAKPQLAVAGLLLMTLGAASVWQYFTKPSHTFLDAPKRTDTVNLDEEGFSDLESFVSDGTSVDSYFDKIDTPKGSELLTTPYSSLGIVEGTPSRLFNFPKDALIGYFCQYDGSANRAARGKCSSPVSDRLVFCPTRTVARYPQYMKRFRSGDIDAFKIYSIENSDEVLAACSNLSDISELRIDQCKTLTPACLSALNRFTNLTIVNLSGSSLSGDTLAKATCWQKLANLNLDVNKNVTAFLQKLSSINSLNHLSLHQTPLTKSDFKLIGRMSNLHYLDISGDGRAISDLPWLSALKVNHLNLKGYPVDQRLIGLLKNFKHLERLTILPSEKTTASKDYKAFLTAIKHELPKLAVD